MFKINLFYPIEYRRRIQNCMTLKRKVKVIWNQLHLKTIEWAISDSLWICDSNRRSICNFTRPWLYLPLSICINCRALAWEGVYVYKLAFFFWLSPRTYHFLFEKRLIIDLRYFWRNIEISLILERSPDYPLKRSSMSICVQGCKLDRSCWVQIQTKTEVWYNFAFFVNRKLGYSWTIPFPC